MKASSAPTRTGFEWLFQNRQTGSITVAQVPNLPMWIFLGSTLVRLSVPMDTAVADWIEGISLASLSWWATLEVRSGVNPWRRFLGLAGFTFVAVAAIALR